MTIDLDASQENDDADSPVAPKIGLFLQCYNELQTGHLERFLQLNRELWDYLYVFDDGSTDGSSTFLRNLADVFVSGGLNAFGKELSNKQRLLDEVHRSTVTPDWLLWLDADEVLFASREQLNSKIRLLEDAGADGGRMGLVNLWRSESYGRVDNFFGSLTNVRLWKYDKNLTFESKRGLHGDLTPVSLKLILPIDLEVVHYGFSSETLIVDKFITYERLGQSGWPLERLVSEENLELVPVGSRSDRLGERFFVSHEHPEPPERLTRMQWARLIADRKERVVYSTSVTIVCLIFKSIEWLEFVYGELLLLRRSAPEEVRVDILFVANDATDQVLDFLVENGIPHTVAPGASNSEEWYINSVYRAYNWGAQVSESEYIYFVNSDMAFDSSALNELLKHADRTLFLSTRLVELGRLKSGAHAIERDFGSSPGSFRRASFYQFSKRIVSPVLKEGGLYMPSLVHRAFFIELGGFPEGNIALDHLSSYLATGHARIALMGEENIPGDRAFILRSESAGLHHQTCFSSVAYHFQEGELHYRERRIVNSGCLVVNDHIRGVNGEEVLWSLVVDRLRSERLGVDSVEMDSGSSLTKFSALLPFLFHLFTRRQMRKRHLRPRVVLANATYRVPLRGPWRLVSLRQDLPTGPLLRFLQRFTMRSSDVVVANDADFVERHNRYNCLWMPIPLSPTFHGSCSEAEHRSGEVSRILFVGAFNDTKGWGSVRDLISAFPDLHFDLVSKYADDDPGLDSSCLDRVSVFRQVSQSELLDLYDRASVFVLGSPYETQCLAALEAASRNVPVVMPPTGTLGRLPRSLRQKVGDFDVDLEASLRRVIDRILSSDPSLAPREVLKEIGLLGQDPLERWVDLLKRELESSFLPGVERENFPRLSERFRQGRLLARRVRREFVRPALRRVTRALSSWRSSNR